MRKKRNLTVNSEWEKSIDIGYNTTGSVENIFMKTIRLSCIVTIATLLKCNGNELIINSNMSIN